MIGTVILFLHVTGMYRAPDDTLCRHNSRPFYLLVPMVLACSLIITAGVPCTAGTPPGGFQPFNSAQNEHGVIWGPYITNTTSYSTVIHWKTGHPVIGRVDYAPDAGSETDVINPNRSETNPSQLHHLPLNNLEPGQLYRYKITGDPVVYSFRTFPLNGSFRFVVYGDTREQLPWWNQSTHHALVAARIAGEPDCLFVVHTGDFVNNPADEGEWGRFFAAAGPMLANTTFFPVPGNHEGDLSEYKEVFDMSPWYSFRCSDADFTAIVSNAVSPVMASEQDRWLNGTLDDKTTWNFVFVHHPLYTSEINHWGGYEDVREKWGPVLEGRGVKAVFSAHVHAYEHFFVNGTHYFTVATGGAPSYALSPDKPMGYVNSLENTLGYMRVTVNSKEVLLEFVPVAEVKNKQVIVLPDGTAGEKVTVKNPMGKSSFSRNNGLPDIFPLFSKEIRIFP